MNSLLVINSSGRITRSITRRLTARFVAGWRSRNPRAEVMMRDVGLNPPPPVDEAWIAAAFAEDSDRAASMSKSLALSETLIDEVVKAEAIVFGVPMYNFGLPAQLKAYFDQIVRVGRTFAFNAEAAEPYRPLLSSKPVVAITSVGDGALLPGGPLAHLNFLEPHLETILAFIGLTEITFVRAGYNEYQDDRAERSLVTAEASIDRVLVQLLGSSPSENRVPQSAASPGDLALELTLASK
jgi:FMN-dependent NADH-azoreductase